MADKTLTPETIASLGKKLDELSEVLSADEHAVLLGLIGTASTAMQASHAEAESEGSTADRAIISRPQSGSLPKLSGAIMDTFRQIPGFTNPGGPVSDSIGVGWLCVSWSKDYNKINPGEIVSQPGLTRLQGMKTYR